MKTASKIVSGLLLACLIGMPVWAADHDHESKPDAVKSDKPAKRASCRVCGMYIDEYIKSAAELEYKDGTKEYTCGVACMLREVEDAGGISEFKSVKVHDWVSGNLVDAQSAVYVVGSQVIPDMVPNYIAFAKREEAEAFAAKEGGEIMDFGIAYEDVSPVGTTAPFRIRTAVTPGAGNFSVGMVYGYNQKDRVKLGSATSKQPEGFITGNRAQPRSPNSSEVHQQAVTLNFSPTDDLALFMNVPMFEKRSRTLTQTFLPAGRSRFGEDISDEDGIGDILLEARYNLWRSTQWDKFFSVLLGTTLPTGEFNSDRSLVPDFFSKTNLIKTGPGSQLGKDVATFTGGLLYSQRWKDLWLHTSLQYQVNPENDSQFKYGDVASAGIALHYTPNYDLMFGIELDTSYIEKNEDQDFKIGNSGGTVTNLAFVSDWRFMNAFGGNFKLRGSVGLPIYEDLNYRDGTNPRGDFQQVQLGDGFFANMAIQWTFRDAPDY